MIKEIDNRISHIKKILLKKVQKHFGASYGIEG